MNIYSFINVTEGCSLYHIQISGSGYKYKSLNEQNTAGGSSLLKQWLTDLMTFPRFSLQDIKTFTGWLIDWFMNGLVLLVFSYSLRCFTFQHGLDFTKFDLTLFIQASRFSAAVEKNIKDWSSL